MIKLMYIILNKMSLETELKDLNTDLSREEEDIVDSIINELNENSESDNKKASQQPSLQESAQPPQKMPPQQMPPQQMPSQQIPPQQMPSQQMPPPPQQPQQQIPQEILNQIPPEAPPHIQQQMIAELMSRGFPRKNIEPENILDKVKKDVKSPLIVSILYMLLSMPQINNLIKSLEISFILDDSGELNIYALVIKALVVGILYYFINKYVNF
jgi:hypothetical protein